MTETRRLKNVIICFKTILALFCQEKLSQNEQQLLLLTLIIVH